jgi:hypothetical protein
MARTVPSTAPYCSGDRHELYFMCDDLKAEILALAAKGVKCSEMQEARRGSITKVPEAT